MSQGQSKPPGSENTSQSVTWSVTIAPELGEKPKTPGGGHATIHVEVVGGPMDGLACSTNESELHLGRRETNDLALPLDHTVSANHAKIFRDDSGLWLQDLGSRNGTFIGGHRLSEPLPVTPGTAFTVGSTKLELLSR